MGVSMAADRYTRRDAQAAFERLMAACGARPAASYDDVGGWTLDYAACYGGYVVQAIFNERGAIAQPFGWSRRSARDFCRAVGFAVAAVELSQANGEGRP